MIYDLFYVSNRTVNQTSWKTFKERFPTARLLENITSFNQIKNRAFTKLFWVVWDDLIVEDDFLFDYVVPKWDQQYIHVFLNNLSYDGITLFPKSADISHREFTHRFFTNKKEVDVIASTPRAYDKFYISTYDEYLEAIEKTSTEMFWVIWDEVEITNDSIFSIYFDHHNVYDRNENHVFKNIFKNEETYLHGIVLFSRSKLITKKEFDYRFLIEKKEHDIVVSKMKPFDIVFISYKEANADDNYKKLISRFPNVKRVHGIKGIHQAHIEAANIASTEMFWAVDADAVVEDSFHFDYEVSRYDIETVHVWRSRNPINDLVYGYGGVKLLPRILTSNLDITEPDMTTSISTKFKSMPEVSNVTAFNISQFDTWKSAFRECVKLSSRIIINQKDEETLERLMIWKSKGKEKPFGEFAIKGAIDGETYGLKYKDDIEELKKINDFDWLKTYYEQRTKNIHS